MQILPPAILLPYIKHYLFLESNGNYNKTLRLFSDGNTGMVFCINDSRMTLDATGRLPQAFIYGQIGHFKDLYLAKEGSFLIVVFQPDGFYRLAGIPASTLKDNIIAIDDLFGESARILCRTIVESQHRQSNLEHLNKFFYNMANDRKTSSQKLIGIASQFIVNNNGLVTIESLLKHTGYTERHIERLFSDHIGMSPKKFANILQLHTFLKLLRSKPNDASMTAICYAAGYFDQSHLIRTFRKYTGITPSEYVRSTHRLAVNFMQFNTQITTMSALYN